jgi:argininosuccinate lyase
MIFSKQRDYYRTRERVQVKKAYSQWSYNQEAMYKKLGKKICEALNNLDEYRTAKERFDNARENIEETIKEELGIDCHWPDWELERLVKQIKEKAERGL